MLFVYCWGNDVCIFGGFHSHGVTPIAGWFILVMDNPVKMDDLGLPPFQETTIWGNHIFGDVFDGFDQI